MKASTVALRDQILAVLRDADEPLTTEQVRQRASNGRDSYASVYQQLRALDRMGLVRWSAWHRPCPCQVELQFRDGQARTIPAQHTCWTAAPSDPDTGITLADLATWEDA